VNDLPPGTHETSTTPAAVQQAESREQGRREQPGRRTPRRFPGEGVEYVIGERIAWSMVRPHEHAPDEPLYRPLRIFTRDPNTPEREGAIATVNVPFEPIERSADGRAFQGKLFVVDGSAPGTANGHRALDLDEKKVLLASGRDPSPADTSFHEQMAYAVCSLVYAAFRSALGRDLGWGFGRPDGKQRLVVRTRGMPAENAYYDRSLAELRFGYYRAQPGAAGRNVENGLVYSSLSHDVIAHEVAHALLDGLRADFLRPSCLDVLALHEGFADLVALFQRFTYQEVVKYGIRHGRGDVRKSQLLTDVARQFGETIGIGKALRTAVEAPGTRKRTARNAKDAYQLGGALVGAVYDAFGKVFARKTERYFRLATNGTGVLPPGDIPHDLADILAEEAVQLAHSFLTMCIRAIDYCPPVDVTLGEFLRAVITADHDVVADDKWDYRDAWIESFAERHIHPTEGVDFLSEDALLWKVPDLPRNRIDALSFAELQFDGDPARASGTEELRRQAAALGSFVTQPHVLDRFGLARNGSPRLGSDTVSRPRVESIRCSRRVGPDGQVVFDLIAEVTQSRHTTAHDGRPFDFLGGATLIIGPDGTIRYVIGKSVLNEGRLRCQRDFMASDEGRPLWAMRGDRLEPVPDVFLRLHAGARR
jgi:hypothetical protein